MSVSSIPYPSDSGQETRLPVSILRPILEQMLKKNSMFQFDITVAVDRILEADLLGIPSQGVARFLDYLDAMAAGDVDPRGRVLTLAEGPSFGVLDGSRALGPVAATKGAEMAIAKAREAGVAVVVVGNSQTLGAAGVYVRLIANAGLIGMCMSSTGGATVAAPGTRAGAVGNCAMAYAVPLADQPPIVFDTACGVESWGKLELLRRYGLPIPAGIVWTETGESTTDLESAKVMEPAGGAFGYGISFLCSVLAGPLAGGWMPIRKKRRTSAEDSQHFFLAINPAAFCDQGKFQAELARTVQEIRQLPPTSPESPVRIPGERAAAFREHNEEKEIILHNSIVEGIKTRAAKMKIEVPW